MAKNEEKHEIKGTVQETLPSVTFRVTYETEEGEEREILAHLSGKMKMYHIRVVPGDTVLVEMPSKDAERGRITRRL